MNEIKKFKLDRTNDAVFKAVFAKHPGITLALINAFFKDEISRRAYEKAEKFRRDQRAPLSFVENKGMKQGMEQGRLQVALNMLRGGMDLKMVARMTELIEADVRSLQC